MDDAPRRLFKCPCLEMDLRKPNNGERWAIVGWAKFSNSTFDVEEISSILTLINIYILSQEENILRYSGLFSLALRWPTFRWKQFFQPPRK
jgi:hypothetical protein